MSTSQRRALRAAAAVCALTAVPAAMGATAPPAAPTNVTAGSPSTTVRWTDNATDESGYVIERAIGSGAFGVVGTAGPDATSFTDPGTTVANYTYRVRARNDRGFSAYGTSPVVFILGTTSTFPVAVTATPVSGTVPLTVTLTETHGNTFDPSPLITWYFGDGTTAAGSTVTHTFTSYATYAATVVVRALSPFGFGYDTGTQAALVSVTAPALTAPQNLAATSPARNSVALSWTNPISDATSIRVQRCVVRRCTTRTLLADLGGSATSFTDGTAKSGTTYTYRLQVANAAGGTATSNEVTIKTR